MTLHNLKNEAYKTRLTAEEKATMRGRLFYVPAVPSPFFAFSFSRFVFAPLVLLLVMGIGTVSAAQGALPGDLLYGVKISVNEQVEVALARTPTAKAQTEARLAVRRVAEAEALAGQGRLDDTTTQKIEDDFNRHASRARALASIEVPEAPAALTATIKPKQQHERDDDTIEYGTTIRTMGAPQPEASSTAEQSTKRTISASLEEQKTILHNIKLRVGRDIHSTRERD
ncbi:hypothetical protein A3D70_01400 [Candidatus Adlerbacteria bacterium RIFCSPHIGHO2_02_FULL_54_18]|uniref:DUF5667 domain-containing protein n=2 Tax=Candidatus Adleribacteriota TaxID=1752736 RepID=A0A1F4Y4U1_9BACT|nr:MAG: hypothetical protein A2949_02950 [Candidatus Adlerbacteria bacterium RIFCSPLOWO2_01_FULL_54_21b]OGC88914.1 MAG: hypothetical protein A3D70_01400 [Candidatus Adlerbacteria bacterium RIFCSPHIGHO2_02_FULL_54_18]OGJ55677.1 MAG: hypothetical protein A2706_05440 [Candidatus Peribacteria bacterium RIFCSPHIGHO2_01_FULL_51_35]